VAPPLSPRGRPRQRRVIVRQLNCDNGFLPALLYLAAQLGACLPFLLSQGPNSAHGQADCGAYNWTYADAEQVSNLGEPL
jgi:hypothetical protein